MNQSKPIQIFKPGKHVAMSGATLSFSEADLAATAAAYDPAKHEAPLVVGHPKHDAPAYGWVKSLAFADGLDAEPHQVDPAFAEMVERGAFKKISASFYTPDSPNNPVPGVYYIRHVGFLGAQPPSVKGLRNPEFADTEEGVIEFSEWDGVDNAGLWRSLREWFIGKFGLDEADKVIPNYQVKSLEQGAQDGLKAAQTETAAAPATAFTEPQPEGEAMSAEDKARLAALEAENAALKAKELAFAEAEKKHATDARHAENVAFADSLVNAGTLLPAHKDVAVAAMDHIAGAGNVIEFGEGDAKKPLLTAFQDYLKAQPRQVEFGEAAGERGDAGRTVEFAAPDGQGVDSARLDLHYKAQAYMATHPGAVYLDAVKAVL